MQKLIYALMALVMMVGGTGCSSKKYSATGKEYVDLGFPSGTKWATCNVGAQKPTDSGDYFSWGETVTKRDYSWQGYNLDRYDKKVLLDKEDVATVVWGNKWRMPTKQEMQELIDNCDWEYVSNYKETGVGGQLGTSKLNGNTIFLPISGYMSVKERKTDWGLYWTSTQSDERNDFASYMRLNPEKIEIVEYFRCAGQCVRAVVK